MLSDNKVQHIGEVYRLIEQFELISRTDLAKLTNLAPASITNFTKALIDNQFIVETSAQNSTARGRPAVGLAVLPSGWQLLAVTLSPTSLDVSLCDLIGKPLASANYSLTCQDYPSLESHILQHLQHFAENQPLDEERLLAISVSVIGRINAEKTTILQLGSEPLHSLLVPCLQQYFARPVLLNEHFYLWLLTESTVGSLVGDDNVIFLQLDEAINLSVLMRGSPLHQHTKMSVDKMLMPKFSPLSEQIFPDLNDIHRYQLANQISLPALAVLVDRYLPNAFVSTQEKITWLCEQIEQQNPNALAILEHISSNLAYMLMNLINIFSTEKIMLQSPLLQVKAVLFEQISAKLQDNLLLDELNVSLVTSPLAWNSPFIACSAIKQGIYEGNLIKDIIQM